MDFADIALIVVIVAIIAGIVILVRFKARSEAIRDGSLGSPRSIDRDTKAR